MEILAPAGSIEQGYSAIEAGCDAIYGGLKIGNARQRAKNFTLNEYSQILKYCKSQNVKFYLTLTDILDIFKSIELPDAVIG